jgi:CheY-like chemotaxis protein
MEKTKILAVCSHPEILQTVMRLVNNNPEWTCTGAANEEQALTFFTEHPFDVVLLGSGMDALSEDKLRPAFLKLNPAVKFVQHYGGGSGLLICEIYEALR